MSDSFVPKAPVHLRCEYVENPLGIDNRYPKFTWILEHDEPNQYQTAYQILVHRVDISGSVECVWDTGKVTSNQSVNIRYEGQPLKSCQRYSWQIRWWDSQDRASPYSEPAFFETAFLSDADWTAQWIANREDLSSDSITVQEGYELRPSSLFRKEFTITKPVAKARIYISGLGYYELRLNGEKVGDRVLEPGQTDYTKTVLYSVYDLTKLLQPGKNAVGIMLGNGRYCRFHWNNTVQGYDGYPKTRAEIHITYSDGTKEIIATDESWVTTRGPIGVNGIYQGEVYDARQEIPGWDLPGDVCGQWKPAIIVPSPGGTMRVQVVPPIKVTRRFQPVSLSSPVPGVYIYDFGQNFTGWVKLTVRGPRGTKVTLRYAETIDDKGMLDPRINRSARATDTYILKGTGLETYEPRFTYHGFRYVEVTGYPGTPTLHSLEGCFVHTAVEQTGSFVCSNNLINTIHRNIIYGQLSNLMSIPTDCPQRDERMGWMGDIQLVAEEAIHNFDMAAFFVKYLQDIKDAQRPDGSLSDVVPPYWPLYPADPSWGTAYVVIAWEMYRYYKDIELLRYHYDGLKKYVDFLQSMEEENGLVNFIKYGDWCPPGSVLPKKTPRDITSAFAYYHDVLTLGKIAKVLGYHADAEKYFTKAQAIREAFNRKYYNPDTKIYGNGDQTSNVLGLQLGICPAEDVDAVVDNLVREIAESHDYHFDTGIVGTKYILDTLSEHGEKETAYRMITQESYPSFGYMIREGATTIWERWEKLTGSGMNSHNHIMFGTVDVWFYRCLAGIRLGQAGWDEIIIKPLIPNGLSHVSATLFTVRGAITSSWSRNLEGFVMQVTIPVNTTADIYIPKLEHHTIEMVLNGSIHSQTQLEEVTVNGEQWYYLRTGSGSYQFRLR